MLDSEMNTGRNLAVHFVIHSRIKTGLESAAKRICEFAEYINIIHVDTLLKDVHYHSGVIYKSTLIKKDILSRNKSVTGLLKTYSEDFLMVMRYDALKKLIMMDAKLRD